MTTNNKFLPFMFSFLVLSSYASDKSGPLLGDGIAEALVEKKPEFNLKGLNLKRVEKLKKIVADDLRKNRIIRCAVIGAVATGAAVGAGYIAKNMWEIYLENKDAEAKKELEIISATQRKKTMEENGFVQVPTNVLSRILKATEAVDQKMGPVDTSFVQDKINENIAYKKADKERKEKEENDKKSFFHQITFGAKDIIGGYAGWLVNSALIGFISSQFTGSTNFALAPLFKAWEKTFHDGNVFWFFQERTKIGVILGDKAKKDDYTDQLIKVEKIGQMQELSLELVAVDNDIDRAMLIQSFLHATKGLVFELEKLVAFMKYKQDLYKVEYPYAASGMAMIASNVMDETNRFIAQVQKVLADQSKYLVLPNLVKNFRIKISAQNKGFSMYETDPTNLLEELNE